MKKSIFLLSVFLFIVTSFLGYFWWSKNTKAVSSDNSPTAFIVTKGKSASQVGQLLYSEGLIKSPLAFKIYVQITGKSGSIQAGEFELNKSMTLAEIVDAFGKGPLELWITIPEGLRREEAVEKIIQGLEMESEHAITFRQEFLDLTENEEGFLFPDTYLFPRDVEASVVVENMDKLFDSQMIQFHSSLVDEGSANGLDLIEIVTLASIIERETKSDEERPVVAGIYLNRLKIGMALQADATTQYAIGSINCKGKFNCDWWPILTKNDLEVNSSYNTYKFTGLPPAPIANPGLVSIEAAIYPDDNNYFYYIHDPDGIIHYAETLSQHNENVRRYLGK